jgi:hypothetical protein
MADVSPAEQYEFIAARLMRALRIQRDRVNQGGEHASHDAEVYALYLANFRSLVYWAAGRRDDEPTPIDLDLVPLSQEINARWPRLRRLGPNVLGAFQRVHPDRRPPARTQRSAGARPVVSDERGRCVGDAGRSLC